MKMVGKIGYAILIGIFAGVINSAFAQTITPRPGWADSYSVNGKCYCATTYDHGIGSYTVDTPAGVKNVREVCEAIGPGPGKQDNPVYNTVQCGHEPGHDDPIRINGELVKDEKVCPGRVDQGSSGCQTKGPLWDLSVFGDGGGPEPQEIPGTFEAEDYSSQSGTRTLDSSDTGGGLVVGFIENNDYLEYDVDVAQSATYSVDLRIASATGGSTIVLSANGNDVGSVTVPDTGGWKTWRTISLQAALTTSHNKLRLSFQGGNGYLVDVNRLSFEIVPESAVLSIADISVDETVGSASVKINLSNPVSNEVQVLAFTRDDGAATGGKDFYGRTQAIRIPAGSTSATMPVTILADAVQEADETFSVRLINPVGADIADGVATVTITDSAPILPTLSISSTTVNENDGEAILSVNLSEPVDASVSVYTRAGTAVGGRDYYGFTRKLNFSGGSTSATVKVTILDDTAAESRETLSIRLINATGAVIETVSATLTINDDD